MRKAIAVLFVLVVVGFVGAQLISLIALPSQQSITNGNYNTEK